MEYNVISADAHIDLRWLPADLFVSNAPAKWKDMVPRLVAHIDHGGREGLVRRGQGGIWPKRKGLEGPWPPRPSPNRASTSA